MLNIPCFFINMRYYRDGNMLISQIERNSIIMKKIGMFCFAGMSTSVLVKKMNEYAVSNNLNCTIEAYSETEIASRVKNLDIVLLGPQIKYMKSRVEGICKPLNVPVMVVSNVDFGRMDATHVLTEALALLSMNNEK